MVIKRIHIHVSNVVRFCFSSEFTLLLTFEIIFSVIIALLALVLFAKFGDDVFSKEVISFDSTLSNFFYSLRTPWLTTFMMIITNLGRPIALLIGSILFVMYLYTKSKKDSLIFSAILYSGIVLNLLLKDMFHRPRPTLMPLITEIGYSFPSFHAMNSFVFYTAIAYFYLRSTSKYKRTFHISILCAIMILLIGISRIYLGTHYPSDVIAGYFAGFFWLTSGILFEKTLIFRRLYKKTKSEQHE